MKTKFFSIVLICLISATVFGQKLITKNGTIEINDKTPLFTIEAKNNMVAAVLDEQTGDLIVSTLVKSFKFREALVEEHFNENYMETSKFPKASFKGKITNIKSIDFKKDGEYSAVIEGELTIHGTTNKIKENAKFIIKGGKVTGKCQLHVSLAAYKVKIEESYKDRISDDVLLTINFDFLPQ